MNARALIVDDEDDIREVAQVSMELTGTWHTMAAKRGQDAVEIAAESQPDVILLDVMMPGLDGPRTLELLRDDPRTNTIPVIFLTAKVQPSEQRRLKSLGVYGLISKPFDPMTLAEQVLGILEARS